MRPALLLLLPSLAFGQLPKFDAADIHASTSDFSHGGFLPNGRVELHGWTLLDLIAFAYGVERAAVFGGPNWLDDDRFEVRAKRPAPSTPTIDRQMLQALLAERFHLAAHTEQKPMPVFELTVARKSSAIAPSETPGECEPSLQDGVMTLRCRGVSMSEFARVIRPLAANYLNLPLVDKTGLTGSYNVTIHWTRPGIEPSESIFDAVQSQLGLKFVAGTEPLPALTIDHVDRAPAPNPPETGKLLPRYTEFEVADLKPSRPGETQRFRTLPGARVEAQAIPLKTLLLYGYETGERWVANLPKWMETDLYDLSAKAPSPDADNESIREMLKSLLAARFQLKTHYEDRPEPVYVLGPPKRAGKLTPSDGSVHSNCRTAAGTNGETTLTCRNMTMAQLAAKIGDYAPAWFDRPIVNNTGLTGAYDFTVSWASKSRYLAAQNLGTPAGGDAAPDPPGGITAFQAVERLLGDKVESQKQLRPVLVVDRIARTPTAN
jgi:uncharacterized protein (TIGR03435 family)